MGDIMKVLKYLLFTVLFMFNVMVVNAVTTDVEPPTISRISFVSNGSEYYSPGDKVYLDTDLKDDVSGIKAGYLWVSRINDIASDSYYNNIVDNNVALSIMFEDGRPFVTIPSSYVTGKYYVKEIDLYDYEDNRSYYYTADFLKLLNEMYVATKSNLSPDMTFDSYVKSLTSNYDAVNSNISVVFSIKKDNNGDVDAPVLDSISMNTATVKVGERVVFRMKVMEESKHISVWIKYSNGMSSASYIDDASEEVVFTYEPTVAPEEQEVHLDAIVFEDIYGNMSYFYNTRLTSVETSYHQSYLKNSSINEEIEDYKFTIEKQDDYVADHEKPELVSVKLNKNSFPVPSYAKVELEAKDNVKLGPTAQVVFKGKEKKISSTLHLDNDNIYRGSLEINQYTELGEYTLVEVLLSDANGNDNLYMNYDNKYKDSDLNIDLKFTLTSKYEPDVTTSTIAKDLIDVIKNAKDGAEIAIDANGDPLVKKEVFDAIKDTDKNILIESNGIEWIFLGRDITKETKDIDVTTAIYYDYNYEPVDVKNYVDKSLIIKFVSNGELPGVATIRIKLDYTLRDYIGDKVYVYYLDEHNEKMFIEVTGDELLQNDNGWFEFKISHNSTYILTNSKPEEKYINNDVELLKINNKELAEKRIQTKRSSNKPLIVLFGIMVIIVFGLAVVLEMKTKRD